MAFEINHDWQGNLATPRARIGEKAKTRLLIVLCLVWILIGLVGHSPWKSIEATSISIVKYSLTDYHHLIAPKAVSSTKIENPPLYYLSASIFAKILTPLLSMHDSARLASGFWMGLTLLLIGMIGRELWGIGTGRQTTFVFISSLGLIVSAHLLSPEVSALTGSTMGFYGFALAKRRPIRASLLLGCGIGIGFMSTGTLPALCILSTALFLPIFFRPWRSNSYFTFLGLALAVALPWLTIWPVLCAIYRPDDFIQWWNGELDSYNQFNHLYFIRTLSWFAWPALPISCWGLWRYKSTVLFKPKFQLILTFFITSFIIIGFNKDTNDIFALPELIPFAVLAGGSVETLKRGAASALNWFGLMLFGMIGVLVWLGWMAIMTGKPEKLADRMRFLSGLTHPHFNWFTFTIAILVTLIWLVSIKTKRSNRAAVTDWAVGITMAWSLLMTLWLPLIDSAKSYEGLMLNIKKAVPKNYACVNTRNLGNSQLALLDYYANITGLSLELGNRLDCDLYLIRDERGQEKVIPGNDWELIWQGKRLSDRRESFRLFQKK